MTLSKTRAPPQPRARDAGLGAALGRALAEATGGSRFLLRWEQRRRLSLVRLGRLSRQGGFLWLQQRDALALPRPRPGEMSAGFRAPVRSTRVTSPDRTGRGSRVAGARPARVAGADGVGAAARVNIYA